MGSQLRCFTELSHLPPMYGRSLLGSVVCQSGAIAWPHSGSASKVLTLEEAG